MRFRKGSRVEVFSSKEAPYGAWRCAEIISGNGHTYSVRYYSFNEDAVVERAPRKMIRPCPPQVDVEQWKSGELVEVLDDFSWKAATVREELSGKYYVVRLLGTSAEFTFHRANVRVRQSWQDERWVAIGKVSGSAKSSTLTGPDLHRKLQPQMKSILLREPSVVSPRVLKRPLPHNWSECAESYTGNPKKIRPLEASSKNPQTGCCQMVRVRSKGFSESSVRGGSFLVADDCYDSDACSVGSCSATSYDGSNMRPCMPDGSIQLADSCSSDAESYCGVGEEARRKHSLADDGARRSCRSELYTYRSTLGDLFASGPLSWEQETSLTDLRLSLNISDDEHLMEVSWSFVHRALKLCFEQNKEPTHCLDEHIQCVIDRDIFGTLKGKKCLHSLSA